MPKMFKHVSLLFTGCFIFFNISIHGQVPTITSFSPASAGFFSYVTITGNNFNNITEVKFGAVPALFFFVNSPTSILAQVGKGASGDITVANASGTANAPNFVFVPQPVITGFSPATGGLGTVVTITGRYFTNTNAVSFGNIKAQSFTVLSDTVITGVLSTGASGYISVNTSVGGGAASTGIFIHTGPTINSFTPVSGPGGTAISIKGTNFTGATSVSVGGIPVGSFTVDAATGISAIVASGSQDLVQVNTPLGSASLGSFNRIKINSFSPTEGRTGDTIQIRGYNFTTTSGVTFGNVPATSFTLFGDTLIKAVVGNGNFGRIGVTTNSFGTASSQQNFFYIQTNPRIFSCNPAIGGQGTSLTIKGKYFTGVSSVDLGGTPVTSYNVVSDSLITAVVGTGSSGYINMINPSGSSSLSTIFTYTTYPLILSYAPASGNVGTVVDIAGVNFANSIAGNKVYFGAVAGTIIAASASSIKVTVPAGADNTALTVITNSKVVSAKKSFLITFPGDTAFTASSFAPKIDSTTGYLSYGLVTGDFDGDGKPDLAVANYGDDNIGVYRNNSTNGAIAFAPKQLFTSSTGPKKVVVGDMDGDGKLDMAAASQSGISVFKNTSTTGAISFAPAYSTSTGIGNQSIAIADFDSDGRPDLVTPNSDNFTTTVYQNTTTAGVISFSGFNLGGGHPVSIAATDLNDDGKPDIMVVNAADASLPAGFLYIYKNNSTGAGSFTFQASIYYFSPNNIADITVGDLDGDGKPDIAVTDGGTNIFIARNTSTNGSIAFAPFIPLPSSVTLARINMADLNGDKKMELVVFNSNGVSSVYKNNSTPGVFSFSPYVTYAGGFASCFSDINGDGKPEMLFTGLFGSTVSILKNQMGPNIKTLCPSISAATIYSNIMGSTYQWQADTGTGFINIADNSNYSGTNSASLQLSSIPSSWYGYRYRCQVNGINYSDTIELRVSNTWTGAVNSEWENPANWSCGTVPDSFTDVVINSGTIIVNSNVTTRSLSIQPNALVTVNTGYKLIVY